MSQDEINEDLLRTIEGYLNLIGDFLKGLKMLENRQQNPLESVFGELWLVIKEILTHFPHLNDIVE